MLLDSTHAHAVRTTLSCKIFVDTLPLGLTFSYATLTPKRQQFISLVQIKHEHVSKSDWHTPYPDEDFRRGFQTRRQWP